MKTTHPKILLAAQIKHLQRQQADDLVELKAQYQLAIEGFNALRLIKNSWLDITQNPRKSSFLMVDFLRLVRFLVPHFSKENRFKSTHKIWDKIILWAIQSLVGRK